MSTAIIRQIFLDIETTGINQIGPPYKGHKIIEIGAVEVINRKITENNFHVYLKPDRLVDHKAFKVHGITNNFLQDKPIFSDIAEKFFQYIRGAELIIHNAPFDISFINYEFSKLNSIIFPKINKICTITDSLALARKIFPGKRNNLDALCLRYKIDNSKRKFHGALFDAQILANVYLAMTGGQTSIFFGIEKNKYTNINNSEQIINNFSVVHNTNKFKSRVILANKEEQLKHRSLLDIVHKKCGNCLWLIT